MNALTTPAYCPNCGTTVNLYRDENNRLHVACACEKQPVRVANKLPEAWV